MHWHVLPRAAWAGRRLDSTPAFPPTAARVRRRWGLSPAQIGVIGCARPLISFPAGSAWSGAADKTRRHRAVLLLTFAASLLARLAVAAVGPLGFVPLLATATVMEAFAAPVTIIVDAGMCRLVVGPCPTESLGASACPLTPTLHLPPMPAVMAACREQADYGKQRLWGAVGWGICAVVAGAIIHRAGLWAAFAGHAVLAAAAFWPTLRLPMGPLHAKLAERAGHAHAEHDDSKQQRQRPAAAGAGEPEEAAGGGAGAWGVAGRDDSALLEAQSLLHQHQHHKGGRPAGEARSDVGAGEGAGAAAHPPGQPRVQFWSGLRQLLGNPEAAIFLAQALFFGFGVRHCCAWLDRAAEGLQLGSGA